MTSTTQHVEKRTPSNLLTRLLSAIIIGPLVLLFTYWGGTLFVVACLAFAALALLEFYALGHERGLQGSYIVGLPIALAMIVVFIDHQYMLLLVLLLIAFAADYVVEAVRRLDNQRSAFYRIGITLGGLLYAALPAALLADMRALPHGMVWIFMLFGITWGADTFAYFGGRFFGKHPLAPRISPKKTVEGALVGWIGGTLSGALMLALGGQLLTALLPLLVVGPLVAVAGDLFESQVKRFFGVKDSHVAGINIIPGHGGILDRTDALIWVTALCWAYLRLLGIA